MIRSRIATRTFVPVLIVLGALLKFGAPETAGEKETFNGIALIAVGMVMDKMLGHGLVRG